MISGVIDDVCCFVHFYHERRLTPGQVVAGADPGENTIDQSDLCAFRWEKTADLGHQHNERDLPDVSRFAGHVRFGHDGHANSFAIELRVFSFFFLINRLPPKPTLSPTPPLYP